MLWKQRVSAEFLAIRAKLCGNCAFTQNFHTRKLGETTTFYAVVSKISSVKITDIEYFIVNSCFSS